ncbi:MAG: InlB B-repeat-containing protein, partial [Treponema sp.]|nr:InlB B-repeat-containing protein [Treponema sp.]
KCPGPDTSPAVITFNPSGGAFVDIDAGKVNAQGNYVLQIERGSTIPEEDIYDVSWAAGNIFAGWASLPNGAGTKLVAGETVHTGHRTYYAYFDTVEIKFNAGAGAFKAGGSEITKTLPVNVALGINLPLEAELEYAGHDFENWSTAASSGTPVTSATLAPNDATTYHAIWQPEGPSKVLWDMQECDWILALDGVGGSEHPNKWIRTAPMANVDFSVEEIGGTGKIKLILPTRDGSSQGVRMSLAGMIHGAKDVIRTGYVYKIEYTGDLPTADRGRLRLEGGNNPLVGGAASNVLSMVPASGTQADFELELLLTESQISFMNTSTSAPTSANRGTEISLGTNGNVPLHYTNMIITRYKPNVHEGIETVNVTFDAGAGSLPAGFFGGVSSRAINIVKGERVFTIPAPTREGNLFMGWYTEADGAGSELLTTDTFNADITYYAYWEEGMTITFNANGGTFTPSGTTWTKDIFMNTPFPFIPLHVAKDGQRLVKWNTDANGTGTDLDTTTNLNAAVTYYAIWGALNNETILFDLKRDWNSTWTASVTGLNSYLLRNSINFTYDQYNRNIGMSGTRGGTSQGIRLNTNNFNAVMQEGKSYRLEYGGTFVDGTDRGRLRQDGGTVPSPSAPVGMGTIDGATVAATSNALARTATAGESFNIHFTATQAEFAAMNNTISFGNETSGTIHIIYTHVRVVEITPAE